MEGQYPVAFSEDFLSQNATIRQKAHRSPNLLELYHIKKKHPGRSKVPCKVSDSNSEFVNMI